MAPVAGVRDLRASQVRLCADRWPSTRCAQLPVFASERISPRCLAVAAGRCSTLPPLHSLQCPSGANAHPRSSSTLTTGDHSSTELHSRFVNFIVLRSPRGQSCGSASLASDNGTGALRCFAEQGHAVVGLDVDPAKVADLSRGRTRIREPMGGAAGLSRVASRCTSGRRTQGH